MKHDLKIIAQIQYRKFHLPDLELLENLYSDELVFSKLIDTSDLVIRSMELAAFGNDPNLA